MFETVMKTLSSDMLLSQGTIACIPSADTLNSPASLSRTRCGGWRWFLQLICRSKNWILPSFCGILAELSLMVKQPDGHLSLCRLLNTPSDHLVRESAEDVWSKHVFS
ncbi:hypothetical protein ABKN59_003091 [Abortiporus biennis]